MFKKILIANRGEIACRVIKTAKRIGIAHRRGLFRRRPRGAACADGRRGGAHRPLRRRRSPISSSTRSSTRASQTGAEAVHPGYGFLSRERRRSPRRWKTAGVVFIGPPVGAIEAMGDKITSKKLAAEAGVSTVPGHMGLIADADEAVKIAGEIGYPGDDQGLGRRRRQGHAHRLERRRGARGLRALASPRRRARFGDDRIFIEKFVTEPRHIEIQVLGDKHGNVALSRRARMLDPAAQPEGDRGGAVAVPRRRDAQGHGRAGGRAGEGRRLLLAPARSSSSSTASATSTSSR